MGINTNPVPALLAQMASDRAAIQDALDNQTAGLGGLIQSTRLTYTGGAFSENHAIPANGQIAINVQGNPVILFVHLRRLSDNFANLTLNGIPALTFAPSGNAAQLYAVINGPQLALVSTSGGILTVAYSIVGFK